METKALTVAAFTGFAALSFLSVPPAHAQLSELQDAANLARTLSEMGNSEEADAEPTDSEAAADAAEQAPENMTEDAAELAAQSCVQAGEQDKAAGIALLFGGGDGEKGLVEEDISEYLVGLCVPDDFDSQFRLNQYLLGKGSYYSFYAERGLEDLADYLAEAGVELGLKVEALRKDRKLGKKLSAENDMEKAGFMLKREQTYSENVDLFVPAIAQLKEEQREEALRIASLARGHAFNATYFLSRGLYVSKEMSSAMARNAGAEASALVDEANRGRGNPVQTAETLIRRLPFTGKKKQSPTVQFGSFVAKNGEALVETLVNAANVAKTFNTDVDEVPQLSQEELDQDARRLNDEWDLPDEFADEEAYADGNSLGA